MELGQVLIHAWNHGVVWLGRDHTKIIYTLFVVWFHSKDHPELPPHPHGQQECLPQLLFWNGNGCWELWQDQVRREMGSFWLLLEVVFCFQAVLLIDPFTAVF